MLVLSGFIAQVVDGRPIIRDLFSDSWIAVDALGRPLPDYNECQPLRNNKYVGIFYWTWHNHHSKQGPFDITKIKYLEKTKHKGEVRVLQIIKNLII